MSEVSIPEPAAPFMGVVLADVLHKGDVSGFLRGEPSEVLHRMKEHIVRSEPMLQAFLRILELPNGESSWWTTSILPAIDAELLRRSRPRFPAERKGRIGELKAELDILEVAQSYTQMTRCGSGKWRGLCPLHHEKTPSFVVFEGSQRWWCFGQCGKGGDVLDLLTARGNDV
jgi:hypothetical protein